MARAMVPATDSATVSSAVMFAALLLGLVPRGQRLPVGHPAEALAGVVGAACCVVTTSISAGALASASRIAPSGRGIGHALGVQAEARAMPA